MHDLTLYDTTRYSMTWQYMTQSKLCSRNYSILLSVFQDAGSGAPCVMVALVAATHKNVQFFLIWFNLPSPPLALPFLYSQSSDIPISLLHPPGPIYSMYTVSTSSSFKGTVAWDFRPLVLASNRLYLGLCILSYIFFEFCFEFAELFKFKIRTALWATAENQIFWEQTVDLKLGWCKPSLVLFIYINCLASLSL